jgi:hypothetical protein
MRRKDSLILSLPPEEGVQAIESHKCYFKQSSTDDRYCWFLKASREIPAKSFISE